MILRRGRKWRPHSGQFPFFCIPDKPVFFYGSSIGVGLRAPATGMLAESFLTLLPQAAGAVGKWESCFCRVEGWRGAPVGPAYLLLPVSFGSASLAEP